MKTIGTSDGAGSFGGLAVVFVVAAIAQAGFPLIRAELRIRSVEAAVASPQASLAQAHDILLDDVFLAGNSPDGVASREGIFQELRVGTDADRMAFVADVNGDGASELVRYEVMDGDLIRSVRSRTDDGWGPESRAVLAHDVESLQIRLLDEDRSDVSPAGAIHPGAAPRAHAVRVRIRIAEPDASPRILGGEAVLPKLAT